MTKERIEMIRQSLIPFVKKELLKINYEGLGKSDAEEFEKDLNEVLDLASKALEQQSSEDCVSRQAVDHLCFEYLKPNTDDNIAFYEHFCDLPPVIPTLPKDITNGDMIKAMFPCEEEECVNSIDHRIYYEGLDFLKGFNTDWWNAPYKNESEDK